MSRLIISQVLLALAIGSGEILFWPKLVVEQGSVFMWIAAAAVACQFIMNMGIARVTIGTRRHVIDQFFRSAAPGNRKPLALVCVVLFVSPWLVPGWALQGSATLVAGLAGQGWLDAARVDDVTRWLTIGSILLCGGMLWMPARVFEQAVKPAQSVMMVAIVVFAVLLIGVTFSPAVLADYGAGLTRAPANALGTDGWNLFVTSFVFAGLGGALNLGYSDYLREAKYTAGDMGGKYRFAWREHLGLFFGGNLLTLFLLTLLAVQCLGWGAPGGDFLAAWTTRVREAGGAWGGALSLVFIAMVYLIFFTSELGIIDVTSRLAVQVLRPLLGARTPDRKHVVAGFVVVLLTTFTLWPRPPIVYLTFTGWANTAAMALYTALLLKPFRTLPPAVRPGFAVRALTGLVSLVFAALFGLLIYLKLRG